MACKNTKQLMKMMPENKKLTVILKDNISEIPTEVKEALNVELEGGNQLNISYQPSKVNITEILSLLEKSQLSISDLSTKEANLEEVFKYLINEK